MPAKTTTQPPRRILLATDLSCRCDRALDRATASSAEWGAEMTASTVVDHDAVAGSGIFRTTEDPVVKARRRLTADLSSSNGDPSVHVRTGDVVEQLLLVAGEEEADLIVTGVARNHWLRAVVLGTVVDGLMRHAEVPVLVVRQRVRGPYRRIVIAGEFSDLSRQALATTVAWFPEAVISFFYGLRLPDADLAGPNRESVNEQCRKDATAEARAFIDGSGLTLAEAARVEAVCECGNPVEALNHHVTISAADLVVVGGSGRGVLFEILIGSKAKQIVENIDCDVLVIRPPRSWDV